MNREIRKFHIAVVQQLQRNVQKNMMHSTLKVKFFFWWPFGDQLFRFSRQRIFLGAKIYVNNKVLITG